MSTAQVEQSLDQYARIWPEGLIGHPSWDSEREGRTLKDLRDFLSTHPNGLERSCLEGHITGSALVVNPRFDRVLLTLHAKLGKWLQLGGHVDGNPDIAAAALREAQEESGRDEVILCHWEKALQMECGQNTDIAVPFDLDIHEIPARKTEPTHAHYDIRYLCVLDDSLPLHITEESKDLRWLSVADAKALTTEESMLRQFEKLEILAPTLRAITR